jgi:hypothetical protein
MTPNILDTKPHLAEGHAHIRPTDPRVWRTPSGPVRRTRLAQRERAVGRLAVGQAADVTPRRTSEVCGLAHDEAVGHLAVVVGIELQSDPVVREDGVGQEDMVALVHEHAVTANEGTLKRQRGGGR